VLLLGQDPYPGKGLAHGLCFSVRPGTKIPGSLRNMFKMLNQQRGCRIPNNGFLLPWARQGVLMLNTVLTVRAGAAGSHARQGWETFTDAVIRALVARPRPVVFVLLGQAAQKKKALITEARHAIVEAPHPSPLSARAFLQSRPFVEIDAALVALSQAPIDWQLPDLPG
jgi:uracil-DNA glycosylase